MDAHLHLRCTSHRPVTASNHRPLKGIHPVTCSPDLAYMTMMQLAHAPIARCLQHVTQGICPGNLHIRAMICRQAHYTYWSRTAFVRLSPGPLRAHQHASHAPLSPLPSVSNSLPLSSPPSLALSFDERCCISFRCPAFILFEGNVAECGGVQGCYALSHPVLSEGCNVCNEC